MGDFPTATPEALKQLEEGMEYVRVAMNLLNAAVEDQKKHPKNLPLGLGARVQSAAMKTTLAHDRLEKFADMLLGKEPAAIAQPTGNAAP